MTVVPSSSRAEWLDQFPQLVVDQSCLHYGPQLLTHYFDSSRRMIVHYGGTVEKFIGDAVMAVWGGPVAQADDVERAVRAALDLVSAVPGFDPSLQARAGVLSAEAAVTIGAQGQGMVAGDLVNTASRIQSAAE